MLSFQLREKIITGNLIKCLARNFMTFRSCSPGSSTLHLARYTLEQFAIPNSVSTVRFSVLRLLVIRTERNSVCVMEGKNRLSSKSCA